MQLAKFACMVATALIIASCASIDEERQQLRGTVTASGNLASEIITWRSSFPGDIPATVVESVASFQRRADEMLGSLQGLSAEATTGTDLQGLKQALQELVDFDTSRIESASQADRASLLDQFGGLAMNLRTAVRSASRR